MVARSIALLSLSAAFIVGVFVIADRVSVAQAPTPPAANEAAPAPEPSAAPPADAEPPAPGDDAATAPSTATPAPEAPATPAPESPAVTATPPVPAPTPPEAPAAATPSLPAPTSPVVATPPAQPPAAPAVAAPAPAQSPTTDVADRDKKDRTLPAKQLFSATKLPSLGKAMAIGYYPRGCLQGGVALPVTGPTWQVMRVSRNRMYGHPELVNFLERFAPAAAKATGWHGILVGDMAQPRGGPLPFGHLSHQIGLDVDIWFMPMPGHVLTKEEREKTAASNLVADDWKHINPKTWTPQHISFIRVAAEQPEVERVLVNAAIKKELCRAEGDKHWSWLAKVRPWYGHNDHIHVRLKCPADSPNCRKQPAVPGGDGCSDKELAYWFSDKVIHPKPRPPSPPSKGLMLSDLPPACKGVIDAPAKTVNAGVSDLR
jgi:penicillin-insensitive murein DD-endopeptidase